MITRRQQRPADRGAVAVELAIVLPVLVMLVFGIIEFGRGYNTKIALNAASREGVRALALGKTVAEVQTVVKDAAAGTVKPNNIVVTTSSAPCAPGQPTSVTVSYPFPYSVPLFKEDTLTISSTAVMRCSG